MTADQLKDLFSTPLMLLMLMLVASFGSALKQLAVARRQGTPMTFFSYFCKIETLIMFGQVGGAWLALIYSDTLNVVSALGLGYVANDTADAWTKTGRSEAITGTGPVSKTPEVK